MVGIRSGEGIIETELAVLGNWSQLVQVAGTRVCRVLHERLVPDCKQEQMTT